jgi:glycosyltransferase involved in cell wall biosynthesis
VKSAAKSARKSAVSGRGAIVVDARYVRERPSGIGMMVEELVHRLPTLLPDERFVFLRHPLARSPLSDAPNTADVTVAAEVNGPLGLAGLSAVAPLRGAKLFFAPSNILPVGIPCPSLVTVHDTMWLDAPELCRAKGAWGKLETAFYATGLRTAIRSATALLTPSQATKACIAAHSLEAAARTTVIPHGVCGSVRAPSEPLPLEVRRQIEAAVARHVPGAKRFVLAIGQAAGYKNHDGVVRGFAAAFPHDEDVHLVLVQRLGDEAARLLGLAGLLGIRHRVRVLSTIPFGDLVQLLQSALCLCHPSFFEGWGMPLTEAQAAGCPVVTSNQSCMPEVTGGAARFVDPSSSLSIAAGLRDLAEDDALRHDLRVRGLARAAELCWGKHVALTAEVIRTLI